MEEAFPQPKIGIVTGTIRAFPEASVSTTAAFLRGLPSTATRVVYGRAINQFASFLGGSALDGNRRDVEAFRAHLEALGRAPATIAKTMAALTGLFAFAVDEDVLDRNPARRARRPKVPTTSPRQGLSPDEVRALLAATDPDNLIGLRDGVLLLLLAVQAWRISEALGLRVEHLGEEGGHRVATVTGKGRKVCRVPLAGTTWQAVSRWLDAAAIKEGPLLAPVLKGGRVARGRAMSAQAAWKRVRVLGQQAGLQRPIHPHLFRHGAATMLLDRGVPLRDVQDHLRHADPRTTRRYDSHRLSLNNQSPHVLACVVTPDGRVEQLSGVGPTPDQAAQPPPLSISKGEAVQVAAPTSDQPPPIDHR